MSERTNNRKPTTRRREPSPSIYALIPEHELGACRDVAACLDCQDQLPPVTARKAA